MTSLVGRFGRIWILGCVGVAAVLLHVPPAEQLARIQAQTSLPMAAVRMLLLVNPLLLMSLAALIGAAVAHRVGLVSRVAGTGAASSTTRLSRDLTRAALLGVLVGLFIGGADAALAPLLGDAWVRYLQSATEGPIVRQLAIGALYGGIAEEIMMRWGMMSLVVFLLARIVRVAGAAPGDAVPAPLMWTGILFASVLFGAGHLPVLAQGVELTPTIAVRTIGLNLVGGVLYGWLFWRSGLEAAMVSHASTHLGLAILRSVL